MKTSKVKLLSQILQKRKEDKLVSNLTTSFICVFSFTILIYLILVYPLSTDKGSSLASMLSFAATLFTPIGAYFFIDNWKEQTKYNEQLSILAEMRTILDKIQKRLDKIQSEPKNTYYFEELLDRLESRGSLTADSVDDKVTKWNLREFWYPNFQELHMLLEELTTKKFLLELYSCNFNNTSFNDDNGTDTINMLENSVKGLESRFFYFQNKIQNEKIIKFKDHKHLNELLEKAIFCSTLFRNRANPRLLQYQLQDKNTKKISDNIQSLNNKIMTYRDNLE